jgi:hypothetical protein
MASVQIETAGVERAETLGERYRRIRGATMDLAAPLGAEDQVVQTIPEVSPTKWHLAHVTWFFERFLLQSHSSDYAPLDERYHYLFNSYYYTVGEMYARTRRGLLSRPTVADPGRLIAGEVVENDYGEADPAPGEESIYDGDYDNILVLWTSGRTDVDLLHAEASRVFDEVTEGLPWPAVHLQVAGVVFAAFDPELGRTDFPAGTSFSANGRQTWERYARR